MREQMRKISKNEYFSVNQPTLQRSVQNYDYEAQPWFNQIITFGKINSHIPPGDCVQVTLKVEYSKYLTICLPAWNSKL